MREYAEGRQGREVAIDAAVYMFSELQKVMWDALEMEKIEQVEAETKPMDVIRRILDKQFHYDMNLELPARAKNYFNRFSRIQGETLQAYVARHDNEVRKLKEVDVEVPSALQAFILH